MFTFESLGPVAQLGQVGPAGAHVQACDQDTRDRDDHVDRGQPAVMPAALAGRGDLGRDREHGRDERRGPAHGGRDGVQGDRQRDREQRAPDRPLRQHRCHQHGGAEYRAGPDPAQGQHQGRQHRDDQADRQRRMRRVRRLGEGKRPEGGQGGEEGTPDIEDPGTPRSRSQALDRCPEGHTSILAAFPRAQASRPRSRQAARPVSTTAYPHSTANPVHGPS
jgi:hypothetical protein